MPSQQILEEEARGVLDDLHDWDNSDDLITVGELVEEQVLDKKEQMVEELHRIKEILEASNGVDKSIRSSLERYIGIEDLNLLPPINAYTGDLSSINYDKTLKWVNDALAVKQEERGLAALDYTRAACSWITNSLIQAQTLRETLNELNKNIHVNLDKFCDLQTYIDLLQITNGTSALLNFAEKCKIDPETININKEITDKFLVNKNTLFKQMTNPVLVKHLNGYLHSNLVGKHENAMRVKFDNAMAVADKLAFKIEMLNHGESQALQLGEINFDKLKDNTLSSEVYSQVDSSDLYLLIHGLTDSFLQASLIDLDNFEVLDDISSVRDIKEKLKVSNNPVDISDPVVIGNINQINSTLCLLIESLKFIYDNMNKALEYASVLNDVSKNMVEYIEELITTT